MIPNHPFNQYQETYVSTSTPRELIALLYEEALRCLIGAEEALSMEQNFRKRQCIVKAADVVSELAASLNMEKGGAIGEQLALLYEHVLRKLLESNVSDTPEPLNEAKEILTTLKAGWDQICLAPSNTLDAEKRHTIPANG
ncbi:MAG: flagellar export chaperone FliS [Nitrospiria bacterium]